MSVSLGYPINSIAVDPETGMVFATRCTQQPMRLHRLGGGRDEREGGSHPSTALFLPPTVAVNPSTGLAYVSGDQLVALNATNGNVVFKVDSLLCGTFSNMVVIPSLNEVAAVSFGVALRAGLRRLDGGIGEHVLSPSGRPVRGFRPKHRPAHRDALWGIAPDAFGRGPSRDFFGALIAFPVATSRGNVDRALVSGNGGTC